MRIDILKKQIGLEELKKIARENFGTMTKAVIDIKKEIMAVGGEMHAEAEEVLLKDGSKQSDLWGINLYPSNLADQLVEFSSLINIRPAVSNRSMDVLDPIIRQKIIKVVKKLVKYDS